MRDASVDAQGRASEDEDVDEGTMDDAATMLTGGHEGGRRRGYGGLDEDAQEDAAEDGC